MAKEIRLLEDFENYDKNKVITVSNAKLKTMKNIKYDILKKPTSIRRYEFDQFQKPVSSMTKNELIAIAKKNDIKVSTNDSKKDILALLGEELEDK